MKILGTALFLLFAVTGFVVSPRAAAAGVWTPLTHTAPGGVALMLLLPDGTVMCQNGGGTGWYRLTPDNHGSYLNGTWTSQAPMHQSRRYYGSQVLRDGRVYVAGGEYGNGAHQMEIYDPLSDSWTEPVAVPNNPIDSCSETLPGGNVLQGNPGSDTRVYDVTNNSYSVAITALGGQDEPSWVKLQDGSILTLTGTTSERFVPSLNHWVADANLPTTLFGYGYEIGAALLLPNGKVFYIGGTNHTAIYTPWTTNSDGIYTPAGTTNAGSWVAGPDIPNNNGAVDSPAAMLVNGKILCCMANSTTGFGSASTFYEYDYQSNAFTQINGPTGGSTFGKVAYGCTMLDLPDGTVLLSSGSSQLYSYQPDGTPLASGAPTILNVTTNLDGSFHLTGKLFNGISEGAAYGDDSQMNSDYPVARITNSSGNVLYCRTYNWSTCNLMTGTNEVTTEMSLPAGLLAGTYPLVVTANGIASAPYMLAISGTPLPAVTGLEFTTVAPNQMAFQWNVIGMTETGYVVQRSSDGLTYSSIAALGANVTNYTDNAVTPLGQYYYRVLGTNSAGLGLPSQTIFAASPSAVALSSPWQNEDVGAVLGSGASGESSGTYTLIGSGNGIGGDNDQFQFVSQPVVGDVTITARVVGSQDTGANAMAGVMIRSSLGSDVAGATMAFDEGAQSSIFEHRAGAADVALYGLKVYGNGDGDAGPAVGGSGANAMIVSQPASAPLWVRLVRNGNTITGYTSTDGSTWTEQGTTTIDLAPEVEVGLAVSSGSYNRLNTSTFDNVTVTGTAATIAPAMAEWKLDETSGTTAADAIDGFDGLYNNVTLGLAGATPDSGYSAGFDGTSSKITIPPLNLNSNVLTITAWVKRNGSQNAWSGIFFDRESSTANGLHFGTANELRYTWANSSSTYNWNSGLVVPDGQWTFVSLVIEPNRARLYMGNNGVLVGATNNVANPVQGFSGSCCIGQDTTSSSRYFKGQLDDVRFYNRALSMAQLSELAAAPAVTLSTPVNGQEFLPPANVTLAAVASGTSGHTINLVQFFNGGALVGQSAAAPYTCTVSNLAAGTYAFSARMYYDSGLAVQANPVNVVVEGPPAVPRGVTASALTSHLIYVSWQPAAGADGYILKRNGATLAKLEGGTNFYVNTGLAANTSYCYTVTATNQVGSSAASASACVTTPPAATALTWDASGSTSVAQDGSGTWNGSSSTWFNGSTSTSWTDGVLAIFGAGATTNCSVTVAANVAPGGILFNANNGGNYTLADGGGSITLSNATAFSVSDNATVGALVAGSGSLLKAGPGYLLMNDTNNFTGSVTVQGGTLEMAAKSGDVAYVITNGATLKFGYGTGGGYAHTGMKIYGDGATATTGLYLVGGQNYNASGQIQLLGAPTMIRQYGSGLAGIGTFDINGNGLWCSAAASGSVIDGNVQIVSRGYGMSMQVDAGANTTTGDLIINGPLNVGNLGLYKRGGGSVLLNGAATSGNAAVKLQAGTIYCGVDGALGQYASLNTSSGTTLDVRTTSQTVADATLAGTLKLGLNKTNALPNGQITCLGGSITLGGALVVANVGAIPLAGGDSFDLINASSYTGSFSSITLPTLPAGLFWDTSQLTVNGSITVLAAPNVTMDPATTNIVYGNDVTLTAVATGTAPLNYQWYDPNLNPISGATGPTLTLTAPSVAASGDYRVIVTNPYGSATNSSLLTVTPALLTVSANSTNRTYGAVNPSFTASYGGFVNGDTASVLSGAPGLTTTATSGSTVGSYVIAAAQGTLSAVNYNFTYVNGTLTVNNAALTITADDASKAYGQTMMFAGTEFGCSGLTNGDTITSVTLTSAGATNTAAMGTYPIIPSAAQGTGLNNYTISYANGTLTVTNSGPVTGQALTWNASGSGSNAVDGSGVWDNSNLSWLYEGNDIAWADGNMAAFGVDTTTNCTVTLANDVTPEGITFNTTGGGRYTIAGTNTIWLTNTPSIVANGDGAIAAPMAGSSLFYKDGAGTLSLNNAVHYAGGMDVMAGSVSLGGGWGNYVIAGDVSVAGGATLVFAGSHPYSYDQNNTTTVAGTLSVPGTDNHLANLTQVGGTVSGTGDIRQGTYWGAGGNYTSVATNQTAVISCNVLLYVATGNYNVAQGTSYPDLVVSGSIQNGLNGGSAGNGIVKNGAGVMQLSGANTYSGTTAVDAGTLLLDGSLGTNTVSVASGATLAGTGVINGATTIQSGGTLAPGDSSIGALTISNTLTLGGTTMMEINQATGTADRVQGVTTLTCGGVLTVNNLGGTLTAGDTFTLFSATSYAGSFSSINLPALGAGLSWDPSQLTVNGSIRVVAVTYTLTYNAGANGSISGTSPQMVNYGSSGSAVTAVPDNGYAFANWSDGSTANPRTDLAVTSNITVTANFVASVTPVSAPWTTNKIGTITAPMDATVAGGAFTVTGSGSGISGKNDNFWFVNQPCTNDVTITARVVSQQSSDSSAQAGVMVRETVNTGSWHVFMGLNPVAGGNYLRRFNNGGNTSSTTDSGPAAPYWVQLVRSGNTFTGLISSNGADWVVVSSATVNMNTNALVGLAVCSGSGTTTNQVVFDNVSVSGGVAPPLATLLSTNVPSSQLGSDASFSEFSRETAVSQMTVTGAPGTVWTLETSTDLVTWVPLQTFTVINGQVLIQEGDLGVLSGQFFRIRSGY